MLAPAGTPPEILNVLNARIRQIMQTPAMKERMKSDGLVPEAARANSSPST